MSSFVFYTYYFKALSHKTETGFCQICAARCCRCCCWASLRQEIKAKQLEIFIGISHKIAKLVFSTYPTHSLSLSLLSHTRCFQIAIEFRISYLDGQQQQQQQ